jgi:hypothetical protein
MESESEPDELPTETNAGGGLAQALKPRSLVRNRRGLDAKTRRNRGIFQAVPECEREVSAAGD